MSQDPAAPGLPDLSQFSAIGASFESCLPSMPILPGAVGLPLASAPVIPVLPVSVATPDRCATDFSSDFGTIADLGSVLIEISGEDGKFKFRIGEMDKPWLPIEISGVPEYRPGFSTAALNDHEFMIIGGDSPQFEILVVNIETKSCEPMTLFGPRMPKRMHHVSEPVTYGDKTIVYIFGGTRDGVSSRALDLIVIRGRLAAATLSVLDDGPVAREAHTMTIAPDGAYLFGGRGRGGVLLSDLWLLDLTKSPLHPKWEHVLQDGPSPRARHTACVIGTKLCIAGGFDRTGYLNEVWQFDRESGWTKYSLLDETKVIGSRSGLVAVGNMLRKFESGRDFRPIEGGFKKLKDRRAEFMKLKREMEEPVRELEEQMLNLAKVNRNNLCKEAADMVSEKAEAEMVSQCEKLHDEFLATLGKLLDDYKQRKSEEVPAEDALETMLAPVLKLELERERNCKARNERGQELEDKLLKEAYQELAKRNCVSSDLAPWDPYDSSTFESICKSLDTRRLSLAITGYFSDQMLELERNQRRLARLRVLLAESKRVYHERNEAMLDSIHSLMERKERLLMLTNELENWNKLVGDAENELKRETTLLGYYRDKNMSMDNQKMAIAKTKKASLKYRGLLEAKMKDIADHKQQIQKLYDCTEDIRTSIRSNNLEDARSEISAILPQIEAITKRLSELDG